jgi:hypothetical protein
MAAIVLLLLVLVLSQTLLASNRDGEIVDRYRVLLVSLFILAEQNVSFTTNFSNGCKLSANAILLTTVIKYLPRIEKEKKISEAQQ